jgi:glycine dehydrogenase
MSQFSSRHIGNSAANTQEILTSLGFKDMDSFIKATLPESIVSKFDKEDSFEPLSEAGLLKLAKSHASENKGFRSIIGSGYYGTHTPSPILRNIFENPGWYTAYTPYQAEISQGRLEALINFQTMICDLTGMEIANSSLLDEGTALSEAAAMALNISKKKSDKKILLVDKNLFPQSLSVLKTRMRPLDVEIIELDLEKEISSFSDKDSVFAVAAQSPNKFGEIVDLKKVYSEAASMTALSIACTDLMFATVHDSAGSLGADIVVGNSQRFGVPLGFGGPHAGFIATKDQNKRLIPGRIIGLSKDAQGDPAYRLALQTREQHIRREKATSNICTAQVLLAVMASMYAVYHGPKRLKRMALEMKSKAMTLKTKLEKAGHKVLSKDFFDTLTVESDSKKAADMFLKAGVNIRIDGPNSWGFSVDETWDKDFYEDFCKILDLEADISETAKDLRSTDMLSHPVFNSYHTETALMRYMKKLENKDFSLVHGMIPLGSCTMKLNAATEMIPVTMEGFSNVHPFTPIDQLPGYTKLIDELNIDLCKIFGFSKFSFQPNSGAQGEYAGLLAIKAYHEANGDLNRNVCLIPSSAHGTNPASAVMAGFKVVVTKSDEKGNIDAKDLQEKIALHKDNLGALMVTYPSTHGVFEENIKEVCSMIHGAGGLVYMDGANMNAMVGLSKPAELGVDVSHLNLHKTFCIPHGGGGPGVGPIGVVERLVPHLPKSPLSDANFSVSSAEFGSASILPISWAYIKMMGSKGVREATEQAILNANYIAKRLEGNYEVLFTGKNGHVAHECIIDTRPFKDYGVTVDDLAKRMIDYGFHAPTMSWPVIGTLMIEPTESESKEEIDRFCDGLISIAQEAYAVRDKKVELEDSPLKNAPHSQKVLTADDWPYKYTRSQAGFPLPYLKANKFFPSVGRVDNAYGDRNLFCTCPSIESFES